MVKPGIFDALSRVNQVANIVERIEVADMGNAVFFKHTGVQVDHILGLRRKRHDIDPPGQRLQRGVWSGGLPETIHHVERRFAAIHEQRLEACAPAGFHVSNAGLSRRLHGRQKIICQRPCPEYGLESVPQ